LLDLTPIPKMDRDIREAARNLGPAQVRFALASPRTAFSIMRCEELCLDPRRRHAYHPRDHAGHRCWRDRRQIGFAAAIFSRIGLIEGQSRRDSRAVRQSGGRHRDEPRR
jgi:hypothetical protein